MIHHVFNSSVVSGPETLVLPNLQGFAAPCEIVLLEETRRPRGAARVTEYARDLGFQVHTFPVAGRLDWRAVRALGAFWRDRRPCLVHAHGPKASLYAQLALRGRQDAPWFLTTHHGVRANDQSLKLRFYEAVYEKLVMPRADLCLTVCASDRELLIRRGVQAEKIAVHLNGVARKRYAGAEREQASREVRATWSSLLAEDVREAFIVGVVGRLSPEKQHGLILDAFARFLEERSGPGARLMCFGSGPLESELKSRTASLGLSDAVHWMGYRSDMAREMTGLDLLLSVSSAEGLPINLIEAGWAGVPVVAHGIDGVRDLIEDGESGILLQPTAGVEDVVRSLGAILDDPERAAAMAGQFQTRVAMEFSKEAWSKRLTEIYAPFCSDT